MSQPWEVGDEPARWQGYLDERYYDHAYSSYVLRNKVNATTYDELRAREDHMVLARKTTMRSSGIPSSYDLAGLQQIHRHLFQDVYEWAGQLRTVGLVKGRKPFANPEHVPTIVGDVAGILRDSDNLRHAPDVPAALAHIYNAINAAHPFREGNGRTQREFVVSLARETHHTVVFGDRMGPLNDRASEAGRHGDLGPLVQMFRQITIHTPPPPAYERPTGSGRDPRSAIRAAYEHPTNSETTTPPHKPDRPHRGRERGR